MKPQVNHRIIFGCKRADRENLRASKVRHKLAHLHEPTSCNVNRGIRAVSRGLPSGVQKLLVRCYQVVSARGRPLRLQQNHASVSRQETCERHEFFNQHWRKCLHAINRNALGNLGQHSADVHKLVLHFTGATCHQRRDDHFASGIKLGGFDWLFVRHRTLVGHAELANLVEFIPKKFEANRMLGRGCKNIEDSPSHRKLTAFSHHVNALVGQLNQLEC